MPATGRPCWRVPGPSTASSGAPPRAPHEVQQEAVDRSVVRRHAGAHAAAARLRQELRVQQRGRGQPAPRAALMGMLPQPQQRRASQKEAKKWWRGENPALTCTISSVSMACPSARPLACLPAHPREPISLAPLTSAPPTCTISSVSMACRLVNSFSRSAAKAWIAEAFRGRGYGGRVSAGLSERRLQVGGKGLEAQVGRQRDEQAARQHDEQAARQGPASAACPAPWCLPAPAPARPTHLDVHLPAGGANRDQGAGLHAGEGGSRWLRARRTPGPAARESPCFLPRGGRAPQPMPPALCAF